jgi:voltage-gated potassium channel
MADTPIQPLKPKKREYDPLRFTKIGLLVLAAVALVSTLVYCLLGVYYKRPDWTFMNSLFMVVITLSTIGYGDWLDLKGLTLAEIYTMFLAMLGFGVPAFIISNMTALIVEGALKDTFRRRRMQQEIEKLRGHVIVCGAGSVGEHCIAELLKIKSKFVVIDSDLQCIKNLQQELGDFLHINGHSDRDETLLQAGIQRAEGLVACLRDDKDNLFITLSARMLNPKLRIVSKGLDDHARKKMQTAGANAVVSPTAIGGLRLISELLRPVTVSFLDNMLRDRTGVRFTELTTQAGCPLAGKTLAQADIRKQADVLVVAVRHPQNENFTYNPTAGFQLEPGCVVVLMGQLDEIDKLRPFFANASRESLAAIQTPDR